MKVGAVATWHASRRNCVVLGPEIDILGLGIWCGWKERLEKTRRRQTLLSA